MRCLACQADNRAGRRFCAACGAALEVLCPACQFANQPDERFCGGCGAALGARAGAPAGGAAGHGRRAAAGDGAVRRPRRLHRAEPASSTPRRCTPCSARFFERVDGIVEGYGGTIDKHIGDCVMAVFGAPVAHGNDAERAVARRARHPRRHAGARRRGRPRRSASHIGIASGQVVASGTGSASHREYTVTGDTVNLASRLTDARGERRDPGLRQRPRDARRAARLRASSASLRSRASPSRSRPGACSACARRRHRSASRSSAGGPSCASSEAALAACRETGRGQAIYMRGEAGIGKTRLVEEFQRAAEAPASPATPGWCSTSAPARAGRDPRAGAQPAWRSTHERARRASRRPRAGARRGPGRRPSSCLPQRSARPAAAEGAARPLRRDGQRDPQPRQARDGGAAGRAGEPGSGRACWWSRTCTGRTG